MTIKTSVLVNLSLACLLCVLLRTRRSHDAMTQRCNGASVVKEFGVQIVGGHLAGVHLHARDFVVLLRRLGRPVLRPLRVLRPQIRLEIRRTNRSCGNGGFPDWNCPDIRIAKISARPVAGNTELSMRCLRPE